MKIVSLLQGFAQPERLDFLQGRLNPKVKILNDVTLIAAQLQIRYELASLA